MLSYQFIQTYQFYYYIKLTRTKIINNSRNFHKSYKFYVSVSDTLCSQNEVVYSDSRRFFSRFSIRLSLKFYILSYRILLEIFPSTGNSLFCFECQGASDSTCSMQNMERKKMRTLCPALNKEQEETDLRAICVHVYFKGNCKLTATL